MGFCHFYNKKNSNFSKKRVKIINEHLILHFEIEKDEYEYKEKENKKEKILI